MIHLSAHMRHLLVIPAMLSGCCAWAGALTPATRVSLAVTVDRDARRASVSPKAPAQVSFYPMIIAVDNEQAVADLTARNTVVFNRRENMLLACVPEDLIDELDIFPGIGRVSSTSCCIPLLENARRFTGVDAVHTGTGLPQGYDGSGVVAAFCDTGFDPHHIAFDGRVGWLTAFSEKAAMKLTADTPDKIAVWETDTRDDHHATHVAGILAGGYDGNKLYGVAPGATIAGTTSQLTDVGILGGIEDIIEFARGRQQPAVINISIGSNNGPHDGTDLFCRYLDLCAEEAVICLSAGNFGQNAVSASHTFEADGEEYGIVLETSKQWNGMNITGMTDIWCDDDSEVELQISVWDVYTGKNVYRSDWTAGCTDSDRMTVSDLTDSDFATAYQGVIEMSAELCPLNNRYNIAVAYDIHSTSYDPRGAWSRYFTAISVRGRKGTRVSFYADGVYSYFNNPRINGFHSGNSDQSISNMCCGRNTISVGACNTLNSVATLEGNTLTWPFETGHVASFSAYGSTVDGRTLPHIAAPGNQVVSAMSGPYLADHPEMSAILTHRAVVDGREHFWYPECGTSMSSPHVAGIFALWLQADPRLGGVELRDIAVATARHDMPDAADARWGAGAVDAVAGLRKVIADAGVDCVEMPAIITVDGGRIHVEVPGRDDAIVAVYDAGGARMVSDAELTRGVYIVRVTVADRVITRKVAIRQ